MAVGEKEQILTVTFHVEFRIVPENMKIQGNEKFRASQRPARVARLAGMNHAYNVPPDLGTDLFQFFEIGLSHLFKLLPRI